MSWVMRLFGADGCTVPWYTVYIRSIAKWDKGLLRHELAHIEQMRRDGQLKYWSRYYWWMITKGYWNNPYEVEARANKGSTGS
jgi:hypothetical protein